MSVCPYTQRIRIVLAHKGFPLELIEIDLGNKPDWFLENSSYSKVPALKVGDATLYESAIINEYLDEAYPTLMGLQQGPVRAGLSTHPHRLRIEQVHPSVLQAAR